MSIHGSTRHTLPLLACAVILLLSAACQPDAESTALSPAQLTDTPASTVASQSDAGSKLGLSLDLSGAAQDFTVETIAAVVANEDDPSWQAAPEYRRVTLPGYPVSDHLILPQILVYPLDELAAINPNAGQVVTELKSVLQSRQPGEDLPFLPLVNASQVMHAQVSYVDFQNGSGVRYLTQFDQAPYKINNFELVYTFQGLTSDGKYYIAALLPVSHPELPDDRELFSQDADELSKFQAYLADTVAWLEAQPAEAFTPSLSALDALVQSIEVK